jgi:hypothetical protein
MAATGSLAGGPRTGCAAFDGRPGRKPPGDGLCEPLGDRLGDAMKQGSVDCPANGAERRLILHHQGEVRPARAQPGGVEAALELWEQPPVVLGAKAQWQGRDPVTADGIAQLKSGTPSDLVAAQLQADVHEEPIALMSSRIGQVLEPAVWAVKHGSSNLIEVDRELRDALDEHGSCQPVPHAWLRVGPIGL